jgi:microcystin-dependent protein
MKYLLSIIFITLLLPSLLAQSNQYLPFQGRLTNNLGVATTGIYAFSFEILGSSYSETFLTVPVNNGLYAVVLGSSACCSLPNNLFLNNNSRQLKISVNGTPIDTVAIYPALKGNIYWSEVQNKPNTIYLDSTYEQQQLVVNGNSLSITNGNTVNLPNPTQSSYFPDGLYVGSTDTIVTNPISVLNNNTVQNMYNTIWQSFVLSGNATLENIKLYFGNVNSSDILLKIYPGIGNTAQSIHQQFFSCTNFNGTFNQQIFVLNNSLLLQKNTDYTFELIFINSTTCSPTSQNALVGINTANPYTGGRASISPTTDVIFELFVKEVSDYTIAATDTAVTFGSPIVRAKNGRYMDKSGFVQPVGLIAAYGGTTAPLGWLLCDGASYSQGQYPELFQAIGTNFGGNATNFNVPDLRGRFPRGVDGIAGNDPDKLSRIASNIGGLAGNNVGSMQGDGVGGHSHVLTLNGRSGNEAFVNRGANWGYDDWQGGTSSATTAANSGNETRPKNVYVNYIIKY